MEERPRYTIPRVDGRWPVKAEVDPRLRGLGALNDPVVLEWHRFIVEVWRPRWRLALLTPCSNVKPYPRSPQSAKIRGVLARLGLWDPHGPGVKGAPRGIEWLYLSDLLGLVPYQKAHEYPACCYELPPDEVLGNPQSLEIARARLREALSKLLDYLDGLVVYLPSKHRRIIGPLLGDGGRIVWVRYHLFYGHKRLEEALSKLLPDNR